MMKREIRSTIVLIECCCIILSVSIMKHIVYSSRYKVKYGLGRTANYVETNDGTSVEFEGNTDRNTYVSNEFGCSVYAKYVEIKISEGYSWGTCARIELYGFKGNMKSGLSLIRYLILIYIIEICNWFRVH